jgi:hypothetical protein
MIGSRNIQIHKTNSNRFLVKPFLPGWLIRIAPVLEACSMDGAHFDFCWGREFKIAPDYFWFLVNI